MIDHYRVVCGRCRVNPHIVRNDDGAAEAVCPGCGQRDNVEDAKRIAGEHLTQGATPGFKTPHRWHTAGVGHGEDGQNKPNR